jgi:hypothetical protein
VTRGGAAEAHRHCDDLADDPARPQALRDFLRYARLPAVCKLPGVSADKLAGHLRWIEPDLHAHVWTDPVPQLYATLTRDIAVTVPAPDWMKDRPARTISLPAGSRIRVTMASRFGDVGISDNLGSPDGYLTRLPLSELGNFGDAP